MQDNNISAETKTTGNAAVNPNKLIADLEQFTGTEEYYHYDFFGFFINMTEGVKFLADNAACYWLIDAILSYQGNAKVRAEEFQVWKLSKIEGSKKFMFLLTGDDGNGNIFATQKIPYSDFPLDFQKVYFIDNILLLPSEY